MTTKKEGPPSRVRARAVIHMQRMLATSAAAMAFGETACHRGPKTTDAGPDGTAFGPPAADAQTPTVLTTDTPDANLVSLERDHGYAVVDPMPRPAHCPDVAQHMKATAAKAGENVVVRIDNAGGYSGFKFDKAQRLITYSGTYVKHSVDASGTMIVTVKPGADGSASLSMKGNCNKGLVTINAYCASDLTVTLSEL